MGLFDFFLSDEKKLAKHIRCLTHVDSQPEDREASAHWLAELGTPEGERERERERLIGLPRLR